MEGELFKVEVNEEGVQSLKRFARLALIVLIVTLVLGSSQTISVLYFFLKSVNFSAQDKPFNRPYFVSVAGVVLGFLVQATQVILYRRFAKLAVTANSNSTLFNQSFKLLNMQAVCLLLQSALTLFFMVVRFFL